MDEMLTVARWAEALGISRQAGHAAVRRLKLEVVDGKLHAAKATAVYRAMTRQRVRVDKRAAEAPGGERVAYDEARRREAVADAITAERRVALESGELLRRDAFRRVMARHLTAAREIALGMPARLAPLLAAESNPTACADLLTVEVHRMLAEIVAGVEAAGEGVRTHRSGRKGETLSADL